LQGERKRQREAGRKSVRIRGIWGWDWVWANGAYNLGLKLWQDFCADCLLG
jgi:hypothetical protein